MAVTVAIAAGVMQDSASLMPLGYSAFWFSGFGLLLHAIREVLFRDSLLTMAAIGAAAGGLTVPALYAMLALSVFVGLAGTDFGPGFPGPALPGPGCAGCRSPCHRALPR